MAYDDDLADRVRAALAGASEKRVFGGLAFLLDRRLTVAVSRQGGLMVRVDPADSAALVAQPDVELMVMQGRELAGWLRVAPKVLTDDDELQVWVDRAAAYVRTLPPKP